MNKETALDFRDVEDIEKIEVRAYDIAPLDPQKRLRVLGGWLLEDIIEDMKLTTFDFHITQFLHQCDLLEVKYPIHEKHIGEIRINFWSRAQEKFKLLRKIQLLENKLRLKWQILNDLKRMGF